MGKGETGSRAGLCAFLRWKTSSHPPVPWGLGPGACRLSPMSQATTAHLQGRLQQLLRLCLVEPRELSQQHPALPCLTAHTARHNSRFWSHTLPYPPPQGPYHSHHPIPIPIPLLNSCLPAQLNKHRHDLTPSLTHALHDPLLVTCTINLYYCYYTTTNQPTNIDIALCSARPSQTRGKKGRSSRRPKPSNDLKTKSPRREPLSARVWNVLPATRLTCLAVQRVVLRKTLPTQPTFEKTYSREAATDQRLAHTARTRPPCRTIPVASLSPFPRWASTSP